MSRMRLNIKRKREHYFMKKFLIGSVVSVSLAFAVLGSGAAVADQAKDIATVKAALKRVIPNMTPDSVTASPLDGLYEVSYGPQVFYVSADGRYVLNGSIVDVQNQTDITEERRSQGRLQVVKSIDPASMIVFSPASPKYTVTIFTDVDCTYCRKMHSEIKDYMAQGIAVRYLAYPRSGVNTPSYTKAVSVWCAKDRRDAMTRAKKGETPPPKTCTNPVQQHMAAAERIGIEGTPTMIMPDGSVIPGYMPAAKLVQVLASHTPTK